MTELLSILYKLRIFTLDELSEALKDKVKAVEALLARYKQQGWIVAIRRNTYCMKDIASGLPVCDKYEIGCHLSPTACISYHTALEFHGLAHQPYNEVFAKSMTRFNSFSFDDVDYTYCRQTKEIVGMMTPKGNPYGVQPSFFGNPIFRIRNVCYPYQKYKIFTLPSGSGRRNRASGV